MKEEENSKLCKILSDIKDNARIYEQISEKGLIKKVIKDLKELLQFEKYFSNKLCLFVKESIEILEQLLNNKKIDCSSYESFYYGIGRAQQYLSMVKKVNYEY